MNVLFDTNVVIDLFTDTADFKAAFTAVDVALLRDFKPWIPACATPSIRYLLTVRKLMAAAEARKAFGNLLRIFSIADTTSADCLAAYEHEHRDYEDDLIAYSAQRMGMDFIIARNRRDFEQSSVPALPPPSSSTSSNRLTSTMVGKHCQTDEPDMSCCVAFRPRRTACQGRL